MTRQSWTCAFACAFVLAGGSAFAQTRVPDTGMNSVGFTIGASMPYDDALESGADIGVEVEHYTTPRVSIRGRFSGSWLDIDGRPFRGTVHPMALEANLVHNWEGGVVHPFVTAGVGWYHYGFEEAEVDSSDNKVGFNIGGGAEYFVTRRDSLRVEAIIRVIPGRVDGVFSDYEPGYWTFAVGYKKYF